MMKNIKAIIYLILLIIFISACSNNQTVTPPPTMIGITPEPPAQGMLNTPQPADPESQMEPQGNIE